MQDIHSWNPPVVTGICDPNKSRAQHHHRNPIFINIYLKICILLKSKWHVSGLPFIALFSNHSKRDFEDFSNWLVTYSGVFPMQYGLLLSAWLAKSVITKKETSHKNILNKSNHSIDPCGTPIKTSNHELIWSFILTLCLCCLVKELFTCFFFNWDSLHARLNSHYNAWSYKKMKHEKIKVYRKSV